MSSQKSSVTFYARKLMLTQLAAGVFIAAGYWLFADPQLALASIYGCAVATLIGFMLQVDVRRAEREAGKNVAKSMAVLYIGAATRFLMIIAAFAFGLVLLKLQPLALCLGFAAAQLCYLILARQQHIDARLGSMQGNE